MQSRERHQKHQRPSWPAIAEGDGEAKPAPLRKDDFTKEELEETKEELARAATPKQDRSGGLLNDDDFLEAMEDVHAWLGQILDQ